MKPRAFTIIEMLFVISLTALLIGVIVSLFGFASVQTANAFSRATLWTQLNGAADRIEQTIREAKTCSIQSSGAAIQCSMPNAGLDLNQNGQFDIYYPSGATAAGLATYTAGGYVWYYTSTASTGAYGTTGSANSTLWRANATTSANPTAANVDATFSQYYNGGLQFGLVSGLSATTSSVARSITFTLTANSTIGEVAQSTSTDTFLTRTLSITRTVTWRNWN